MKYNSQLSHNISYNSDEFYLISLYNSKFNEFPDIQTQFHYRLNFSSYKFGDLSKQLTEIANMLTKEFGHILYNFELINNPTTFYSYDQPNKEFGAGSIRAYFINTVNNLILSYHITSEFIIFHVVTNYNGWFYTDITDKIKGLYDVLPLPTKNDHTCFIVGYTNDYYLKEFTIKNTELNLNNYNDDFVKVSKHITTQLTTTNRGIVLLHGEMGTGKTSYLRSLMTIAGQDSTYPRSITEQGVDLSDRRLIYIPPEMATRLSSPEFITFLSNYPNSILLIEDAENILKSREAGDNQAVSNILNASDGILGDLLQLQFVCTFNCDIKMIDSALLRPGRLIAEYEFKRLTLEKTRKLINELYDIEYTDNKELTIAEIYNYNEILYKTKEEKSKIGFV